MEPERRVSVVDYYTDVVLPALAERLDAAFPEVGWGGGGPRRDGTQAGSAHPAARRPRLDRDERGDDAPRARRPRRAGSRPRPGPAGISCPRRQRDALDRLC